MTGDQYIQQVLAKYDVTRGGYFSAATKIVTPLGTELRRAFGNTLSATQLSGSDAEGTAVVGSTDVDVSLSFAPASDALRDI